MTIEFAKKIKEGFDQKKGPTLTLIEAQAMAPILTDNYEVYALQKGDVTFLAWITGDKRVIVKINCW